MLDEAVAAQVGLNRTDLRCLGIIYRRGRLTAGELAEESGLTPGAITTVLDRMERAGFANRVADPADRRRVLVVSTAAAREVGGRLYGEVEVASSAELAEHSAEELGVIRDYLRRLHDVYVSQAAHVAGTSDGAPAAPPWSAPSRARPRRGRHSATSPRGASPSPGARPRSRPRRRRGGRALPRPLRGPRSGGARARRRPSPSRRSAASGPSTGAANPATCRSTRPCPWAVSLRGGMWQLRADLRGLRLESLEVTGGASDVEIWLPEPTGTVPVRIAGGASEVRIHRPGTAALRAVLSGGASRLEFGDQRLGAVGGHNVLSTPGFDEATDRYEVRFSGGASQVTVDVA